MPVKAFWDIEKKILVPFLTITLIGILLFAAALCYSGFTTKTANQQLMAGNTISLIRYDIEYLYGQSGAEGVMDKYKDAPIDNILIEDGEGNVIFPSHSAVMPANRRTVLSDEENPMGWQISYVIDQTEFINSLIEEQKYTILATIALLLLIIQSSILIAGNISMPLRRLSSFCRTISAAPQETLGVEVQYIERNDEIGQLANSFQRMLENIQYYTEDIMRVKNLNETIVESLPIAVVAYDNERREVLINGVAKTLLEKTEYTYEGKTLSELLSDHIENPKVLYDPIHLENSEGKGMDIELGIWQLTGEQQQPWGSLCTMDNVTYKKLLEKRAQQDEKLVYAGKLAASLAHEIRNPLAGIRTGVQVVEKRLEQPDDRTLCKSIIGEVDRVNLLVENLVDLTRRREMKKTLIDVRAFLEELILLYTKVADNNHIAITADCPADVTLYADQTAMKQIFINLINNSIKALKRGGNIALRVVRLEEALECAIEDDGPGIPPNKLAQLNSPDGAYEGGGLGIPIVTQLVGQNGGALSWQSAPGQGTRAVITFQQKE